VRRRALTIHDVLGADEVFLTNALWGVMPLVRLEKERIGGGRVGPVTAGALSAWRAAVASARGI
jgi:branched-subunit amino acid aminotransferase/4-amino-4-deoxychorismate lyase